MRTKWTVPGICAALAFVMAGFYGCGTVDVDKGGVVNMAETITVDMGGGVHMEFVNIPDSNAGFPASR